MGIRSALLDMLVLILFLIGNSYASPTMCHCPNGGLGMSCPQPIQLNCPQQQCSPAPPCNPFPTLPTVDPNSNPFSFPTLAPLPGSPFGQATTLAPLPGQPGAGQGLLPIAPPGQAIGGVQPQISFTAPAVSAYQQASIYQQAASQSAQPPPPPPAPTYAEATVPTVDATTKATTLPSEQYVEADLPESDQQEAGLPDTRSSYGVFENEPNNGYRQPVRRQTGPVKPTLFNDKCNDERLKKIIEDNVDSNPSSSKRKIQKAASDEIGGLFDVICSAHDFSYLANTQLFCEAGNDDVTCFAFLHSLIQ